MSEQIIIADASPLIALARIEHIHLLRLLFDEVSITQVVEQEVLFGGNFADAAPIERAIQAGWLRV